MALTGLAAKNARPASGITNCSIRTGSFFVTKAGTRSWRFKYRYGSKEKLLTFGHYPEVTPAAARDQRDKARGVLREGKDPGLEAHKLKRAFIAAANTSFRSVADAWLIDLARQARQIRLEKDIYPEFGKLPISEIDSRAILAAPRKIERRGAIETAKRVRGYIFAIFERAIGDCLVDDATNPATRVAKILKKMPAGAKQPALTDLPSLVQLQHDIDNSTSHVITKLAFRLLALTTVRVGVVVAARWNGFDGIDWERPEVPVVDPTWRILPPA